MTRGLANIGRGILLKAWLVLPISRLDDDVAAIGYRNQVDVLKHTSGTQNREPAIWEGCGGACFRRYNLHKELYFLCCIDKPGLLKTVELEFAKTCIHNTQGSCAIQVKSVSWEVRDLYYQNTANLPEHESNS